jgi:hypothetical protein
MLDSISEPQLWQLRLNRSRKSEVVWGRRQSTQSNVRTFVFIHLVRGHAPPLPPLPGPTRSSAEACSFRTHSRRSHSFHRLLTNGARIGSCCVGCDPASLCSMLLCSDLRPTSCEESRRVASLRHLGAVDVFFRSPTFFLAGWQVRQPGKSHQKREKKSPRNRIEASGFAPAILLPRGI